MSDNNDPIFTLDIGTVLARLHLSSMQQLVKDASSSGWDPNGNSNATFSALINTGIVGMVDITKNGNPFNSSSINKNVTFDLSNPSGIYEIGVVVCSCGPGPDDFDDARTNARQFLYKYFSGFATKFKAKDIEESDLVACLVEQNLKMTDYDSYKQYKYTIPYESLVSKGGSGTWTNQLCFKAKYAIDIDGM